MTVCRALFEIPPPFSRVPGILVVEDDPALAYAITCLLEDRYRLYLARTGEKALSLFQLHRDIDLVLLDYRLPDMSGLEVLQNIKSIKPSLPVIFITGCGSEDVAIKAFTMGAKDYIRKRSPIRTSAQKLNSVFLSMLRPAWTGRRARSLSPRPAGPPAAATLDTALLMTPRHRLPRH